MGKVKIHPLILAALIISSVTMAINAYRNFRSEEMGYGIVFMFLCLFLAGMVIFGIAKNRTSAKEEM